MKASSTQLSEPNFSIGELFHSSRFIYSMLIKMTLNLNGESGSMGEKLSDSVRCMVGFVSLKAELSDAGLEVLVLRSFMVKM